MMDRELGEGKRNPLASRLFAQKCCSKLHIYTVSTSLQCKSFLWAGKRFCSRKCHVETPKQRRKWGVFPIFLYHKIKDGSYKNRKINKLLPTQNMPTLQAAATAMCKPIIFWPSLKKKKQKKQKKTIGRSLHTIWKLYSVSFLLLHNVEYSFSGLQSLKKEQFQIKIE